jgi:hypothetical protein
MIRAFFLGAGAVYLLMGARLGSAGALMMWLGLSLVTVGLAYTLGRPQLFGKRSDGTFHPLGLVVHAPYLLAALAAWQWRRRREEDAWNEVSPGIFVGRMAAHSELPPGTALVVDMTCELVPPRRVRAGNYRCLPTLDGTAPERVAFAALVKEVAAFEGPVFIHCAAGRGRSATLAAAVLIARGLAPDAATAETMMKARRKVIKLGQAQKALLAAP